MDTLEEFIKRLDNLLDFIDENKEELIHKHDIGLKLNYSEIGDDDQYTSELKIGVTFGITFAVYSLLEERPEFIEFFEKTIETTKSLSKRYQQDEVNAIIIKGCYPEYDTIPCHSERSE